jgi:quercetin dioxygenase-like cupin family protein
MSTPPIDRAPEAAISTDSILHDAFTQRRHLAVMGATIDIHATLDDTHGAFSTIELRVPPRFPGAPRHWHRHMPESFYMLEGSIEILRGDTWTSLAPGQSLVIPPGRVHAYRNVTDDYARFLVVAPGHDRFFVELVEWMHREPVWPPEDHEALLAFGKMHDTLYV